MSHMDAEPTLDRQIPVRINAGINGESLMSSTSEIIYPARRVKPIIKAEFKWCSCHRAKQNKIIMYNQRRRTENKAKPRSLLDWVSSGQTHQKMKQDSVL